LVDRPGRRTPGRLPGIAHRLRSRRRTRWDCIERFESGELNANLWIPEYLPHWTTPERSRARYRITSAGLELRIDADQPGWRTADGEFRTSHVQTAAFAGPEGSRFGQHRIGFDLTVRTPGSPLSLWTPDAGSVEVGASANSDPTCTLGVWLVGHEQTDPDDPGEICIAKVFGNSVATNAAAVRVGIKAHHDPRLTTDVLDVSVPIDATRPHTYGAEWGATGCAITVYGTEIYRTCEVLAHPL